jgi:hypothetical protein
MKFSIGDYTADRVIEPSAAIVTRLINQSGSLGCPSLRRFKVRRATEENREGGC